MVEIGVGKRVAVVGATGAVGTEMVTTLHARKFPVGQIELFASERSAARTLETPYGVLTVNPFSLEAAREADIILLAVSGDFAKQYGHALTERGAVVIDNSSAFRLDADIPLIVPEINGHLAKGARLIANPNCTTAILVVALAPLDRAFGLKKVIVSTYQAASGAGAAAMAELRQETANALAGRPVGHKHFVHPIAFNVIPHIDSFQDNGYTREEMKVVWESQKILGRPELAVSCTAVRIPTFRAHAESVTIETHAEITPAAAVTVLMDAAGVTVVDDPAAAAYPMPLTATGEYNVEVGRIRRNLVFGAHGLDLFLCGDQLLKGAALNAVQIAECVIA
ncbi:MAG: aspartate-semialdehyde dehydrogenase [Azospirillaceae bacterium]|nr:aspartate-semialdehyde dehydrogenase [Azospirillaceae bacterium]